MEINVNVQEVYKETLQKRSDSIHTAIEALGYHPGKEVIENLGELRSTLHAIDEDINAEIKKIEQEEMDEEIRKAEEEEKKLNKSNVVDE